MTNKPLMVGKYGVLNTQMIDGWISYLNSENHGPEVEAAKTALSALRKDINREAAKRTIADLEETIANLRKHL